MIFAGTRVRAACTPGKSRLADGMIGVGFRDRIKHTKPVLGLGDEGIDHAATQGVVSCRLHGQPPAMQGRRRAGGQQAGYAWIGAVTGRQNPG